MTHGWCSRLFDMFDGKDLGTVHIEYSRSIKHWSWISGISTYRLSRVDTCGLIKLWMKPRKLGKFTWHLLVNIWLSKNVKPHAWGKPCFKSLNTSRTSLKRLRRKGKTSPPKFTQTNTIQESQSHHVLLVWRRYFRSFSKWMLLFIA